MRVPERLAQRLAGEDDGGRAWRDALPALLDRLAASWELELGEPVSPGGVTSLVLPARRADGSPAMLKVPVLDDEVAAEPAALALVAGDGAVRLLAHDPDSGGLLLEAADPARSLLDVPDAERATATVAQLLARWWRPVPEDAQLPRLVDVAPRLIEELERRRGWLGRQIGGRLIDRVIGTFCEADPRADTLLHTDLHQGNVLAAEREPWLVIDPKPLVGEPAYDLEPLLRDHRPSPAAGGGAGDRGPVDRGGSGGPADHVPSVAALRRRFDATSTQLDLDRGRAREWVIARAVQLGAGSLEAGDPSARRQLRVATVLASS